MKMTKYKTNKGVLIEEYDECSENPRQIFEHFTTFYTFLRNSISPDENPYSYADGWMKDFFSPQQFKVLVDALKKKDTTGFCEKMVDFAFKRGYVLLPVWKMKNSSVCYKTAMKNPFYDDWDSGLAGVIYCSKSDIYKEYQKQVCKSVREEVSQMMSSEVNVYSLWANGEVYCYTLEEDGDEVCYSGWYGDISENGILDELGITEYEEI
jgi:hypothetical protein